MDNGYYYYNYYLQCFSIEVCRSRFLLIISNVNSSLYLFTTNTWFICFCLCQWFSRFDYRNIVQMTEVACLLQLIDGLLMRHQHQVVSVKVYSISNASLSILHCTPFPPSTHRFVNANSWIQFNKSIIPVSIAVDS